MPQLNVLIPVDGSAAALDAVRHALVLTTKGLRARFVVANVQSPANLYEMVVAHDPQVLQQVSEAAGLDLLKPAVELLQAAGLAVEPVVLTGDPAHALMDVLERHRCEAVFLSAHGASGQRAHVGRVAQAVLDLAPVPVTVVRPRERAPA